MNKLKIIYALSVAVICLAWVTPQQIVAQSPVDLGVAPPTAYMKIKPGSTATHSVVIENFSDQLLRVNPRIVDFTSDNSSGVPILSDKTNFPYFDLDPSGLQPISLPPKAKAELALKITVPTSAPNQEYPLTILFESEPDTTFSISPNESPVRSIIGSNFIVLISAESDVASQIDITSFKTSSIVDSFRPLSFTPTVTNTGYAATAASGSAHITNWQGKTVATFPIRPVIILAKSSRELETTNTADSYTTQFRYKPPFLIGIYKVTLDLTIQKNDQPILLTQTKTIIALPISLILGLVLVPISWGMYKHFLHTKV